MMMKQNIAPFIGTKSRNIISENDIYDLFESSYSTISSNI